MTRVLVVGAGPAGVRAAERLAEAGLRPVVVDEAARSGGQIHRRPPPGFTRPGATLYGAEAGRAAALHATFDRLRTGALVDHRPETSVVALRAGVAHLAGPEGLQALPYDRLILATGAMDRLVPVPGWQGAGVYTLGAVQIALKAQGVVPGGRIVLAGSGPLLTLVAHQLRRAGARVEAVLDTAPLGAQAAGLGAMALARPGVTLRGLAMRAGLGLRYHAGARLGRIAHGPDGPVALHWRDAGGAARETPCDAVGLGWHLRAETHLADLAGARFNWSELWQQHLPQLDDRGRAGPGLYIAGDGASLSGAEAAEIAGRRAAEACLEDLGLPVAPDPAARRRLARLTRFAAGVARAFPWPARALADLPDATVVCRCEGVTAGEIRATLGPAGADLNRLKSLSRLGMGRCQGRYCAQAGAAIAAAAAGVPPADLGRLRSQPPVRPLPASLLARTPPG